MSEAAPRRPVSPAVKAFLAGAGLALLVGLLAVAFMAYQHPALLIQFLNVNYCS